MGIFKSMKDMKQLVNDAPALVENARAAQRAWASSPQPVVSFGPTLIATAVPSQPHAATAESTELLAPIAGVSLSQYAEVSRGLAAYGYDTSKAVTIAASIGIDAPDWATATDGWAARMTDHPDVAREFNRLYTGR